MRPRLATWTVLTGLVLLVSGCNPPDVDISEVRLALDTIAATCAAATGDVQVKRRQNAYWEPVAMGAVFWPGDWVRTGRDAWMRIEFVPGGGLELDADSVAIIEAPEPAGPGEGMEARVAVESGAVRGFITPGGEHRSADVLRIRDAEGAEARLVAEDGDEAVEVRLVRTAGGTEVAVDTGRATLNWEGESRLLESGGGVTFARAGVRELRLLPSPGELRPRTEARVRLDPMTGARLSWRPVPGAEGYRIQIARDSAFRIDSQVIPVDEADYLLDVETPGRYVWRVAARDAEGRHGPYGPAQRLFLEAEAPEDLLLEPAAGERFGHSGEAPTIRFSWQTPSTDGFYRLVVATSANLIADEIVSEVTGGGVLEIDTLEPGEYHWGVFEAEGEEAPLFLNARPLTVRALPLSTPRVIRDWGAQP